MSNADIHLSRAQNYYQGYDELRDSTLNNRVRFWLFTGWWTFIFSIVYVSARGERRSISSNH